jgi:long-subunit acyl-CoA synthetase (AMP-forming)
MAKLQNLIGGRCIAVLSGSAPLAADIQIFCQTALCCPVRQGYGLTETCAASCVSEWCDNTPNQCGPPTPATTIRLADWKDGNYFWSDKDKPDIGVPRGEVLVAGNMVCAKYFEGVPGKEDPAIVQKNKDDFVMLNGMKFFRTGDIGQITANGCIQIIDRKKDLWKGPQGEYVALTKVEGVLKLHPVIEIPMCYGKTGGNWPIAIICADKGQLVKFAENECSITGKDPADLMKDAAVNKALHASIKALCKANGLIAMEMPEKIVFSPELWTPENELLTTTMKLKRPQIVTFCKAGIDEAYGS